MRAIAFCLLMLFVLPVQAQEGEGESEANDRAFSFTLENDLFTNLDRHYTNGIGLAWADGGDAAPAWATRAANLVPFFQDEGITRAVYGLGQNLYTPDNIRRGVPDADDRPYAGWLYGSIGLLRQTPERLDQLQLSLGVVGPAAMGEPTQKFVHKLIGSPDPRGWSTGLDNEPAVLLVYQRSWRPERPKPIGTFEIDLTPNLGGALGNVFTYAEAGATLRFGPDLPDDYGPPRLQPGLPGSAFFGAPTRGFSWYAFAGVEGRAVLRNLFLDGNTFSDSRRVDKNLFVGDLQIGLALTFGSFRLAAVNVLRTDEFDGQKDADAFGGLSLSLLY